MAFGRNEIPHSGTQRKSKSLVALFSANRLSNCDHRYFEYYLPSKNKK